MGAKIPLATITFPGQTDWAAKIQQPEKTGAPVSPCAIARAFCGNVLDFCASGHSPTHSPDRGDGVEIKILLGEWASGHSPTHSPDRGVGVEIKILLGEWASGRVDTLPRTRPIEGMG